MIQSHMRILNEAIKSGAPRPARLPARAAPRRRRRRRPTGVPLSACAMVRRLTRHIQRWRGIGRISDLQKYSTTYTQTYISILHKHR